MQSINQKPPLTIKRTIKRDDISKINKGITQLKKESHKAQVATDSITLAEWVEKRYENLKDLKPVDVVAMLKKLIGLEVSAATFRNYLKAEKIKRENKSTVTPASNVTSEVTP